jgi:hypothetical protein
MDEDMRSFSCAVPDQDCIVDGYEVLRLSLSSHIDREMLWVRIARYLYVKLLQVVNRKTGTKTSVFCNNVQEGTFKFCYSLVETAISAVAISRCHSGRELTFTNSISNIHHDPQLTPVTRQQRGVCVA